MKRWFISRMGDYDNDGTNIPKVAIYPGVNFRIWSSPGFGFCLGQLAAQDLTALKADTDIKLIPDASLDNVLTSIPKATRDVMVAELTAGGFNVSAVKTTWSVRQLLKHLKLQLQTDDNIESGDVRDVP